MCGIAGIVDPQGMAPSSLVKMTQLIRYRGPDGYGFAFINPGDKCGGEIIHKQERLPRNLTPVVGLGNRRLAILDISDAGSQPMQSDDGALTITFNGEIYNYKEIREELEQIGHHFRTQTDTEVILLAYRQWGPACLCRFNGMWALALWDNAKQFLFCARDRFGVKPFYYALHAGKFFFASEIKQILEAAEMSHRANPRAVFRFLEWGLMDYSSETFFENIYQLPGGHSLTLKPHAPLTPQVERYWELQVEPQLNITEQAATEEFRSLLESAVRLRLRSDVPVGVSLSGGLDSSSVICQARRISPGNRLQTFSACFEDPEIDEREYLSEIVHAVKGVAHRTFPQARAFWNELNTLIYHLDEPIGSTAAFAQWCVMAEARAQNVPVVLGGQGGDEILCGYSKYYYFYLWHLLRAGNPRFVREAFQFLRQGTSSHRTKEAVTRYLPGPFRTFSLTRRLCTDEVRELWRSEHSGLGPDRSLAERQRKDLTYASLPALLHHEDRMSMAHSIETRLPFMDYRLVEFGVRCPPSLKLRDGWSKWLLREATAGMLPERVRLRKTKLGFDTPGSKWMDYGLRNGHKDMLQATGSNLQRFINGAKLQQECEKLVNRAPGALPAGALFRAVSLVTWSQVFSVN
jgi:asparagine synthase (glutamine-hydrolysing)